MAGFSFAATTPQLKKKPQTKTPNYAEMFGPPAPGPQMLPQAPQQDIGAMLQGLLGGQQQAPGINWAAIERISHPPDPGAQAQHYTAGVMDQHNPFANGFFNERQPIPVSTPPTPAPFSSFGSPTSSTPYVPPAPRNNPFDAPAQTQPNGNPIPPPDASLLHRVLSHLFGM